MYFFLQKWIIVHRVLSYCISDIMGFPDGAVVKNLPANAGNTRDTGSVLGKSP